MSVKLKLDGRAKDYEFVDISTELWRKYVSSDGGEVIIEQPQWLHVSKSGGHRILDLSGHSWYIPPGWVSLVWNARPGEAHFVA